MSDLERFGEQVWIVLCRKPLGSLTKKELELLLLQSAISAGMLKLVPVLVAKTLRLGLAKAYGYLTDLALRMPELSDITGVTRLAAMLCHAEFTADDSHLAIPVKDASLRIWVERKLSTHNLHLDESLRRELVKLTPSALYRVLDEAKGMHAPNFALNVLLKRSTHSAI